MPTSEYRWALPEDVGTYKGEMSARDVFDMSLEVAATARTFDSEAGPDDFTVIRAAISAASGSVDLSYDPRTRARVTKINRKDASLDEANDEYGRLLEHIFEGGELRFTAKKVFRTEEGDSVSVTVISSCSKSGNGPIEWSTAIYFWRTIGDRYAVEHVLRVQDQTYRGKRLMKFDNNYRLLEARGDRPNEYRPLREVPVNLQRAAKASPDITANLTYDRWYELIKRQLTEADIIRP
jgi:hypothetical protein